MTTRDTLKAIAVGPALLTAGILLAVRGTIRDMQKALSRVGG